MNKFPIEEIVSGLFLNLEFYLKKLRKYICSYRKYEFKFSERSSYTEIPLDMVSNRTEKKLIKTFSKVHIGREIHHYHPRKTFVLKETLIDTQSGLAYLNGTNVVRETSSWSRSDLAENPYNGSSIYKITNRIEHKNDFVTVLPSSGFYHWLIEDLPRYLFLFNNFSKTIDTLVFRRPPKYVMDLLVMLNIDYLLCSRIKFAQNLVFSEKNAETGYPNPYDLEILRRTLLPENIKTYAEKIYVSRLKSSRSPTWERSMIERLKQCGWSIVECEELSLEKQIQIFAGAKTICGLHGAGLSGIVWARPGTRVIELRESFRSDCFVRLSELLGHVHVVIQISNSESRKLVSEIESFLL